LNELVDLPYFELYQSLLLSAQLENLVWVFVVCCP